MFGHFSALWNKGLTLTSKGRHKCIQHFIQHWKFSTFDFVAFVSFQNLEKNKKEVGYEVCSRSDFSSNIFWFIRQYFHVGCVWVHFHPSFLPFNTALSAKHLQWSVLRTFECFFHNQNTKKSIFKHRQLQARQGKKKQS